MIHVCSKFRICNQELYTEKPDYSVYLDIQMISSATNFKLIEYFDILWFVLYSRLYCSLLHAIFMSYLLTASRVYRIQNFFSAVLSYYVLCMIYICMTVYIYVLYIYIFTVRRTQWKNISTEWHCWCFKLSSNTSFSHSKLSVWLRR